MDQMLCMALSALVALLVLMPHSDGDMAQKAISVQERADLLSHRQ
jgi:hypothetical protein